MNKILALLPLFFICSNIYAQDYKWFSGISRDSAQSLADSFVYYAKTKFLLKDISEAGDVNGAYLIFRYIKEGTESSPEYLLIPFVLYHDGRNDDLQIKGTPKYYFHTVRWLQYLDVIHFWKRFIDPDIDIEATSKKYMVKKVLGEKKINCLLSKEQGRWKIKVQN